MTARGPVVIDWVNARLGDGDLDTALTALILAGVLVTSHPAIGPLLEAFLAHAPGDPLRLLDEAVEFRRWQLAGGTPAEMAGIEQGAEILRGPGPITGPEPAV